MNSPGPVGYAAVDRGAFEDWLRHCPGFEAAQVRDIYAAEGGVSNLTSRVGLTDAPYDAVCLRLERADGIFAPYDVIREARLIAALAGTTVPVPRVVGVEPAPETLGAPFAVTEWVDAPHMGVAGPPDDPDGLAGMVSRIHAVEVERVVPPLDRPGSPREALLSQIDDIEARMRRAGSEDPELRRALALLRETVPSDGRLALCQGDINIFNYLVRGGAIVAVVDWERAHIGDPRSDVGHLVALGHLKGAPWSDANDAWFVQRYGAVTGGPLEGMAWFRARWLTDLAVIHESARALGLPPLWFSREEVVALMHRSCAEMTA